MSIFTKQELAFLEQHKFCEEDVYDGRGESKRFRESQAKDAGKILILTSVPCQLAGHRIRTRAGHCAQCKPASIGFTTRETAAGYVYIAGSRQGQLIKIGVAGDMGQRSRQLNAERYGGYKDWVVLIHVLVNECGRLERLISNSIRGERVYATYWKDGSPQMIRCSFSAAFKAYQDVLGPIVDAPRYLRQWREYDFG